VAKRRRTIRKKKKKSSFKFKLFSLILLFIAGISLFWATDILGNYYDKADGYKGESLKTAIHELIRDHTYLNFDQNISARYWWDNYFTKTDWHPDKYYWDMYSSEKHDKYIDGNKQSREHCMPRSWWGKRDKYSSYDANGDLHNIFPSDNKANSAKGNLPLGEVGIARFDNGVSKVGQNTYPKGYKGTVFEPADEYKGDFARVYFYMITCYEDYAYNWRNDALKSMLKIGNYPGMQPWAIEMLLKWHRNDPVSDKEIKRNTEIYRIQGNRNPFIDNPELIEYIWGDKVNMTFNSLKDNKIERRPQLKDLVWSYMYKIENITEQIIERIKIFVS